MSNEIKKKFAMKYTAINAFHIMSLSVDCATEISVGGHLGESLFVIPIRGGVFFGDGMGEGLNGIVLPGGADWNTRFGIDEITHSRVRAEYLIQTDDGVVIRVLNEGQKSWDAGRITQMVTSPRFEVAAGKYDWLNFGVYAGTLIPREDKSGVEISIFRLE